MQQLKEIMADIDRRELEPVLEIMTAREKREMFRRDRVLSEVKRIMNRYINMQMMYSRNPIRNMKYAYLTYRYANNYIDYFKFDKKFMNISYLKSIEITDQLRNIYYDGDPDLRNMNPEFIGMNRYVQLLVNQCKMMQVTYEKYYREYIDSLEKRTRLPTDVIVFCIMEYMDVERPASFRIKYSN